MMIAEAQHVSNEAELPSLQQIFDLVVEEGIPAGTWVAVSEKKFAIMATGDNPIAVHDEAVALGESLPLMIRVPERCLWVV